MSESNNNLCILFHWFLDLTCQRQNYSNEIRRQVKIICSKRNNEHMWANRVVCKHIRMRRSCKSVHTLRMYTHSTQTGACAERERERGGGGGEKERERERERERGIEKHTENPGFSLDYASLGFQTFTRRVRKAPVHFTSFTGELDFQLNLHRFTYRTRRWCCCWILSAPPTNLQNSRVLSYGDSRLQIFYCLKCWKLSLVANWKYTSLTMQYK